MESESGEQVEDKLESVTSSAEDAFKDRLEAQWCHSVSMPESNGKLQLKLDFEGNLCIVNSNSQTDSGIDDDDDADDEVVRKTRLIKDASEGKGTYT